MELLTGRFAKLQDTIGQKISPRLLEELLKEDIKNKSFLDILNKLEKLEIIESAEFWLKFREIRNSVAHEYPDNPQLMVKNLNQAVQASKDLLEYWAFLKGYLAKIS